MDEADRLLIVLRAHLGDMSDKERTKSVQDLISDGLSLADIARLAPGLLGPVVTTGTGSNVPTLRLT